jgi:hypothetical protein
MGQFEKTVDLGIADQVEAGRPFLGYEEAANT